MSNNENVLSAKLIVFGTCFGSSGLAVIDLARLLSYKLIEYVTKPSRARFVCYVNLQLYAKSMHLYR